MIKLSIKQKETKLLIVLLGISVSLMICNNFFKVEKIRNIMREMVSPVQELYVEGNLYLRDYERGIKNFYQLIVENKELNKKIVHLTKEKKYIQRVLLENERLRKMIRYQRRLPYETVLAKVVVFDPSNLFKMITINKGSKHGLTKDMEVVTFMNNKEELVGRVMKVGRYTSQVILLLDRNSQAGVFIKRNKISAVLVGNNYNYKLNYVDNRADIQIGDEIITSGQGGVFTEGFLVGKISKIKSTYQLDLFYDLDVLPTLDQNKLEEVLVIVSQ
ncbi:rod shape-determining protein MreC [bacterium]|nr:rod shape-determining protein MreC [bacterium]MBU0899206.1 rod shape-determining protein MreC [bacterium]MBU1153323.1 rod shape-determining protein MreC [bacterium]MBU1781785.1 rod shape-determining protein MreC [bacterium]MBU2599861.1 rod shape-determining protein MreC [bacterium]